MRPLRVDIELMTPWVPPAHGVHLDGLVAWAMADQCLASATCTQAMIDEALDALPFERHGERSERWCWKASLLQPVNAGALHRHFATAKTDADRLARGLVDGAITGPKTIDLVRGMSKNDLYRFTSQEVTRLQAYCVGDQEALALLLSRVRHVGGRGRLGFGAVKRDAEGLPAISVTPDPEAAVRWQERHLPSPPTLPGYIPIQGRCLPPYWESAAGSQVWRPIDAG